MRKKATNKYYISVEGETEKYYFEHLSKLINESEQSQYKVKFIIKVDKSIISNSKRISSPYSETAFHICDYESNDDIHIQLFNNILNELNTVKKYNPNLNYSLGYSNFTFELWIILHKKLCISPKTNRTQYLSDINSVYNTNFSRLKEYKHEDNFKYKILSQISLNDVRQAITYAREIRKSNDDDVSKKPICLNSFKYYRDNPDLTIFECVEKIFKDCKI